MNPHSILRKISEFIFPIFLLLIAWEVISRLGFIKPFLFPPPSSVMQALIRGISSGFLVQDILHSLYRLLYGFALSVAIGCPLGMAMGASEKIFNFFRPIVSVLMPIPSIAWTPILILWLGLGDFTCAVVVLLSGIFPMIYNSAAGVRSISKYHIWAAQSLGIRGLKLFTKVMLPGSIGYIVTGLRLAVGSGWRALVAAEMLAATLWGLGYRIQVGKQFLAIDLMYAGIILLALLGMLLEQGIMNYIEQRTVVKWGLVRG